MDINKKIQKNIKIAPFTTYQIGGDAKYYLELKTKEELSEALAWAKEKSLKVFYLGGGSNILAPDNGINGLVVHFSNDNIKAMGERIECGAGASLSRISSQAINNNLSGLEWSAGIPRATIGGAVRGNAGAFGTETKDIVETIEVFNLKTGDFEILSKNMFQFAYRTSLVKKNQNYLIWQVVLKMQKDEALVIEEKVQKSINFRKDKYPNLPSAGSIFENLDSEYIKEVNPILFEKEIKDKVGREAKVGAGLIIDLLGFKGKTFRGIKVSLEHANHIVNTGNGTANDVVMLISLIKQQVRTKLKIQLKEEITYFGFI